MITPQTEIRVAGEGMPTAEEGDAVKDTKTQLMHHSTRPKGDLVVRFNIVFPQRILTKHRDKMIAALHSNEN